MAEKNS